MPRPLYLAASIVLAFVASLRPAAPERPTLAPRTADGRLLLDRGLTRVATGSASPADAAAHADDFDAAPAPRVDIRPSVGARLASGALVRDVTHAATWLARSPLAAAITGSRTEPAPATDPRELLAIEGGATYLPENLARNGSLVTRWHDREQHPLRLWFAPTPGASPEADAARTAIILDAFARWREAGVPIRVIRVADSAASEVQIRWVDSFATPISGKTRWVHDAAGWIRRGDITLALEYVGGMPLGDAALGAIGMHEIGHLFGLDHTSHDTSIMAPRVRVRDLSEVDRASARLLYRLPAGFLR